MDLRIGQGIDTHRLVSGRALVIGGVTIPYERGLEGHSDADVLTHAVIDALLGAIGERDIGNHFSNRDERWRGADSFVLLTETLKLVRSGSWRVVNLDCNVLAEAPRLAPYIPAMCERLSQALDVPLGCVAVKPGTVEGLGALGRGEGISATAIVLLAR